VEYAEGQGYQVLHLESSKSSVMLQKGPDKIVVATDQDGHGVYFSVRDSSDAGFIIDFVQSRMSVNLGVVRRKLRPWIGGSEGVPDRKPSALRPSLPIRTSKDRAGVVASLRRYFDIVVDRHSYLESRAIVPGTVADPRFRPVVLMDERGAAIFPHRDRLGWCGYEIKNAGMTGFAKGGQRGLWQTPNVNTASRVVVVESAIDALSHAQLSRDSEAAYISTGGSLSASQTELLRTVFDQAAKRGAAIIIATDNDPPGHELADKLQAMAGDTTVVRELPRAKDWNEQLQQRREDDRRPRLRP
jgi:5S rRNA maturation endonuclease (ribonuclease M5)